AVLLDAAGSFRRRSPGASIARTESESADDHRRRPSPSLSSRPRGRWLDRASAAEVRGAEGAALRLDFARVPLAEADHVLLNAGEVFELRVDEEVRGALARGGNL